MPGYLADTGLVYGKRKGEQSFGWNADNRASRTRHILTDPRRDSFNVLRANASWKIALADGQYDVTLVAGNAARTDSVDKINANGVSW